MSSKILNVNGINLEIEKINPPRLIIIAKGEVSSGGWTNGRLIPYVYIKPPTDGIYEFDFVADPPSGKAPQVISPIASERFVWDNFPIELLGVKVYASLNNKVKQLP